MRRAFVLLLAFVSLAASAPPLPCPDPDQADPGCVYRSPEEQAKIGTRCEMHSGTRLRLGLVPIQYGIVGCAIAVDHQRFPNAKICWSGGCLVDRRRWAEVAYCPRCRTAFYWAHPQYILHPIRLQSR
jgi:hypothetical protein